MVSAISPLIPVKHDEDDMEDDHLYFVSSSELVNSLITAKQHSGTQSCSSITAARPRPRLRCRSGDILFRRFKFIRVVMCILFVAGRVVVHVLGWLDAMLLEESPQLV